MISRELKDWNKDREDIQEIPMGILLDHKSNLSEQIHIEENSMPVKKAIMELICFKCQMRVQEIMRLSEKWEER